MAEIMDRVQFYCQKVLPLVYDDSLSYYEQLCKVVDYLNRMIVSQNDIVRILGEHESDIVQLRKDVDFLQDEMEKVKNGDYVSLYLDSIICWIDNNLNELLGRIAKFAMFEIDDDGYFNAIIPDSWCNITFDTTDKGELMLKY